jgi:hypothetical protein
MSQYYTHFFRLSSCQSCPQPLSWGHSRLKAALAHRLLRSSRGFRRLLLAVAVALPVGFRIPCVRSRGRCYSVLEAGGLGHRVLWRHLLVRMGLAVCCRVGAATPCWRPEDAATKSFGGTCSSERGLAVIVVVASDAPAAVAVLGLGIALALAELICVTSHRPRRRRERRAVCLFAPRTMSHPCGGCGRAVHMSEHDALGSWVCIASR